MPLRLVAVTAAQRVRDRIQTALDRDGWTQREFAQRMNKSQPWLVKILSGENQIRLDDLDAVAGVLRVPVAELIRAPEDLVIEVTPSELQLVRLWRQMDEASRLHISGVLNAITKSRTVSDKRDLKRGHASGKTPTSSGGFPYGGPGTHVSPATLADLKRLASALAVDLAAFATGADELPAVQTAKGEKP